MKNPQSPIKYVEQLQDENSNLKKQIESLLRDKAKNLKSSLKSEVQNINGINLISQKIDLDQNSL